MTIKTIGARAQVRHFLAPGDGRLVAIFVPGQFDDYRSFPPFEDGPGGSFRADVTAQDLPLQIFLLNRPAGAQVRPHYHDNRRQSNTPTRHQVLIGQAGLAQVIIYTKEGERLGQVEVCPHDLILLTEGHAINFVEPGTRLLEIKMGPFPETDANDKVDLPS